MVYFAYDLIPHDWEWEFQPTVAEVAAKFAASDAEKAVHEDPFDPRYLDDFNANFAKAKEEAKNIGWEGDYQTGHADPRVFFIPNGEGGFSYGFAWKQVNNGTTFVLSPVRLPHLEDR